MSQLPTPTAKRLRRPSFWDSRLIVGVLLVLVAATLGARVVASTDDRLPVYVATRDLVVGDRLDEGALGRVDVRLADGVAAYLSASAPLAPGQFVLRDLRAGELVPAAAVGTATSLDTQLVTVSIDAVSATALRAGTLVDVFLSDVPAGSEHGAKPKAVRALEGVGVAGILGPSNSFGSAAKRSVQLYVPRAEIQHLIESLDGGAKVTLVPVPGRAETDQS